MPCSPPHKFKHFPDNRGNDVMSACREHSQSLQKYFPCMQRVMQRMSRLCSCLTASVQDSQLNRNTAHAVFIHQEIINKLTAPRGLPRRSPHPSTNRALCRLTSEVRRDPVHSTRYGRQQKKKEIELRVACVYRPSGCTHALHATGKHMYIHINF